MTNSEIIRILKEHGIRYFMQNGQVYSQEPNEASENLSSLTRVEFMLWLGYEGHEVEY